METLSPPTVGRAVAIDSVRRCRRRSTPAPSDSLSAVLRLVAAQAAAAIEHAGLRTRLGELALTDPLTGLATERMFDVELPRELARARRGRIGVVLQAFHLLPTMTALENVAVPLELSGRPDAFDRAREELAAVGLADRTTHYPAQLSGGEQQRVAIARATAPRPQIIFADEPTSRLDPVSQQDTVALMHDACAATGCAVLLVTHEAALAAAAADRVVALDAPTPARPALDKVG